MRHLGDAWQLLLGRPWVRPRANARYVTLHDALAEELAQRVIPLHDQDGAWRKDLWRRAKQIYAAFTAEKDERVDAGLARVSSALKTAGVGGEGLVAEVSRVDAQKRELDQLLTAQLHYAILDDFSSGTERFLELFQRATERRDPLFMELICHEMEMFLPRDTRSVSCRRRFSISRWSSTAAGCGGGPGALRRRRRPDRRVPHSQRATRVRLETAADLPDGRDRPGAALPPRDRARQRQHAHPRPRRGGARAHPRGAAAGAIAGQRWASGRCGRPRRTRSSASTTAISETGWTRTRPTVRPATSSPASWARGAPPVPRGDGLDPDQLGLSEGAGRLVP